MDKEIVAIREAVAISGPNRSWIVRKLWENGFFGTDPFCWNSKATHVGLSLDEVMACRYELIGRKTK